MHAFSTATGPTNMGAMETSNTQQTALFSLNSDFVGGYAHRTPPFGFNGLGDIVYLRTYARLKADGARERWHETVERVVNGTFRRLHEWKRQQQLPWDAQEAQMRAQTMYDKIYSMKFLPPGRGLWAMGSALTEERRLYAALNNCAFVSTRAMWDKTQQSNPAKPFAFLMDAAMLGVGVGFDTRGTQVARDCSILVNDLASTSKKPTVYRIPDSREGWVESVRLLINSYLDPTNDNKVHYAFDYGAVRPAGQPIRGFGGMASGPKPLAELHAAIRSTLQRNATKPLSVTSIVDLMNLVGKCVVSGNVRRTAEIAFGDPEDAEYVDLKSYDKNPHRMAFGWTSNNSVFARLGMDYTDICKRVAANGEPGFQWMDNARRFGRMGEPNHRDTRLEGANPCNEQGLESYELCCLVETFPFNHATLDEYLETLESAYLYAKTVTLLPTHWPDTNSVMLRNRRIGTSVSGIAQFLTHRGVGELHRWLDTAYQVVQKIDSRVSEELCVATSVKTTTVKPSGTVSLLAGATPGMHYPESRFCIRRVRVSKRSDLLPALRDSGYHIEEDVVDKSSVVVEFPIDHGEGVRGLKDVSIWEQLSLAALLQRVWSDNQVSCTVTFDPCSEGNQLGSALDYFQYQLKGVSFLPRIDNGAFPQMPYEAIDEAKYRQMVACIMPERKCKLHTLIDGSENTDPEPERYCTSDRCVL
ncbi:hypothetical protein EV178_003912 [Coemansia sp. RSA 1646]|nr:hypothetical protein EV178_003912 [Coemansia sp. RSA 1646]